ncbi:hypothetical protein PRJ39_22845 [Lysobacter enzymogenes]|uniref:hypothetical protein n=1 Tax=Lysobacter enzymogenes TaxID=69 RepID=UPI0037498D8B
MKTVSCFFAAAALMAVLAAPGVNAQQYAGGRHAIATPQGELVVNSGFVNNLNAHTFQVYSFLLKPNGADEGWQQVPLVDGTGDTALRFTLSTANTADFALRDAKVSVAAGKVLLQIAQKKYKDTPYDDDATVEVRRYELKRLVDEQRWIFEYVSARNAGREVTVEQALNAPAPGGKKKK